MHIIQTNSTFISVARVAAIFVLFEAICDRYLTIALFFPPNRSVYHIFSHCCYRISHCCLRLTVLKSTNHSRVIFLRALLVVLCKQAWDHCGGHCSILQLAVFLSWLKAYIKIVSILFLFDPNFPIRITLPIAKLLTYE